MLDPKSLTVIIPAFNEERMVQTALESVFYAVNELGLDYEILVINDGSSDKTESLASQWIEQNNVGRARVITNARNRGLGYSIQEGFKASSKDYAAWFPGDSSVTRESLIGMWSSIGQADMIIPYMENILQRPFNRKFLSLTFTRLINVIFRLNIKYYNGLFIVPTSLVRTFRLSGQGHEIFCELVVRALKSGCSYKEVPFTHRVETERSSKAISMRNVNNIMKVIAILIRDIYITRKPLGT